MESGRKLNRHKEDKQVEKSFFTCRIEDKYKYCVYIVFMGQSIEGDRTHLNKSFFTYWILNIYGTSLYKPRWYMVGGCVYIYIHIYVYI